MEKSDFAKRLADKLIEQLKAGTAPWQQPWEAGQILSPYNPTTGNRYRGINILALMTREYADPRWMTYRQAQAQGWQVRGGEKATQIQHWIWEETRPRLGKDGQPELDSEGRPIRDVVRLSRPKVIAAAVFNAEQIDGIPELEPKTQKQQWDPIEQAEKLLRASNARIEHSAVGGAYYRVSSDTIYLPARERFENAGGYYSTALHELGHWTGHVDRLNRDLSNPFGSEAYAREELRAEIASLILGSELGLGYDPQHHAGYVDHWIKILTDTPQEILYAAADAERISEYILTIEQRQEKKQAQAREYLNDRQGLREIRKGYWEVTELEIEPEQLARDAEAVAALGGSFIIANGEYVDVQRCINFKKEFEQDLMQGALFRAGRNLASYLSALLPAEESGLSLIRSVTKAFQGADEESKNQFLDGFRRLLGFTAASHPDYDVWLNPDAGEGTDDVSLGPEEEVREKASFRTLRRSEWCQVLAKELAKLPVQERKTNMKEHVPQSDRTYLAVPYDERAEAKAVGARWDATKKAWYVGPEVDPTKIARWELRHQPEPTLDPRAEFAEVLRSLGAVVEGDHPIMNGERQRIRTENDKRGEQTIFYIGHLDGVPNGYAENNRTKEVRRWKARGQHLSEEQRNRATQIGKRAARDAALFHQVHDLDDRNR
jgi:antirestriction protein ArdC